MNDTNQTPSRALGRKSSERSTKITRGFKLLVKTLHNFHFGIYKRVIASIKTRVDRL